MGKDFHFSRSPSYVSRMHFRLCVNFCVCITFMCAYLCVCVSFICLCMFSGAPKGLNNYYFEIMAMSHLFAHVSMVNV